MMHIIPAYIHAYRSRVSVAAGNRRRPGVISGGNRNASTVHVQVAQIQLFSRRHKYTEVMTSDAALLEWITGEL